MQIKYADEKNVSKQEVGGKVLSRKLTGKSDSFII